MTASSQSGYRKYVIQVVEDSYRFRLISTCESPELCRSTTDHDLFFLHLPSTPSPPWLLSISRASWHILSTSKRWWHDHLHIGPPKELKSSWTCVTRPSAQFWLAGDWVWIPGGPRLSPQTLGCMRPSTILLRIAVFVQGKHHPCTCKGRQWNFAPSQ